MDYKTFVKAVRNLPTPSTIFSRITDVLQDPLCTASEIAEVVRLDPAITSKVLRLANSAYIGIPRTVSSLLNAIVILGNKRVHSLVMASELLNSLSVNLPRFISLESFWMHSLTAALIAESIAQNLRRLEIVDENEVFVSALLHDIGKLVLAQFIPDSIREAHNKAKECKQPFWTIEDPELHHTIIGEYLADNWGFPENLRTAIKWHHAPEKSKEFIVGVSIVHVADVTTHLIGRPVFDQEVPPEISKYALENIALPPERFRVIAENAISDKKRVDSLLEVFSSTSSTTKTI